jgi:hypothetical protein
VAENLLCFVAAGSAFYRHFEVVLSYGWNLSFSTADENASVDF